MAIMTIGIISLVVALVTLVLGVITLAPSQKASKKNMIGYKSVCSLTPVSTVIMAVVATGLFLVFANTLG